MSDEKFATNNKQKRSDSKTNKKKLPVKNTKKSSKNKNDDKKKKRIWKVIPGYSKYQCSNNGKIRRSDTKELRKLQEKMGYHYCCLFSDGQKPKNFRVHRLVAKLFVKNKKPDKYTIVNHIDGNKLNNNSENLEWTTISGNNKHSVRNNLTGVTKRRISQYVADELYENYDSLTDASKATGFHMSRIVEVCKGQREEYEGFVFKYSDVNHNEKIIDPEKEGFKKIKSFPNYWISSKGEVYSKSFKKFMKLNKHKTGCLQIQFSRVDKNEKSGVKRSTVLVHNLMGIYFLKKPTGNFNCVKHKDGNRENNNIENLEWGYVPGSNANFNI